MDTSSTLTSILLDGGAGYNRYTTKIEIPRESFIALSPSARGIIRLGSTDPKISGTVGVTDLVPDEWDEFQREAFYNLSLQEQIDVCAFVTSIVHECCHHMDLLRTPFGASFHEKLCREFISFEHWVPTLLESPSNFFNQPLVDWAQSHPPGLDVAQKLQEGTPLDQALVELRGPIAFDEVFRGTMPRYVQKGWCGNDDSLLLTGERKYEAVTINQLWASIRLKNTSCYLGPKEIIEGRTLAMCLLYLFHLLGESASSVSVIREYIDHFYKGQSIYLSLLEIHSGLDINDLLNEDIEIIKRRLWEAIINGWYSLHAPISIEPDDILQSMTARCVQVALVMRDTDLFTFSSFISFLSTVESYFAKELGARPIQESLQISAERLNSSIAKCNDCKDSEMQSWYRGVLKVIQKDLLERTSSGYALATGLPMDGNPINRLDDGAIKCLELHNAPECVNEWYKLRQFLLVKRGRSKEKVTRLRDFFSYLFV